MSTATPPTVLVMTGKPEAAAEARARLGAANVFTRPFDIDALLDHVTRLVGEP